MILFEDEKNHVRKKTHLSIVSTKQLSEKKILQNMKRILTEGKS